MLLWIGLTDDIHGDVHRGRISVSILVVVDRTHGRLKTRPFSRVGLWFQSLLLWIGLTDARGRKSGATRTRMFQSLLLWIGLTDTPSTLLPRSMARVSILVVVDRTHGHENHVETAEQSAKCFNPCCCGSDSRTRTHTSYPTQELGGFNPCCCGSDSRTLPRVLILNSLGVAAELLRAGSGARSWVCRLFGPGMRHCPHGSSWRKVRTPIGLYRDGR